MHSVQRLEKKSARKQIDVESGEQLVQLQTSQRYIVGSPTCAKVGYSFGESVFC